MSLLFLHIFFFALVWFHLLHAFRGEPTDEFLSLQDLGLARFPPDADQQLPQSMMHVPLTLPKQLMVKFHTVGVLPLVKVVHVELTRNAFTCRMKEEKLECLKQWGNTWVLKSYSLMIQKDQPLGRHLIMCSFQGFYIILHAFQMKLGTEVFRILLQNIISTIPNEQPQKRDGFWKERRVKGLVLKLERLEEKGQLTHTKNDEKAKFKY